MIRNIKHTQLPGRCNVVIHVGYLFHLKIFLDIHVYVNIECNKGQLWIPLSLFYLPGIVC